MIPEKESLINIEDIRNLSQFITYAEKNNGLLTFIKQKGNYCEKEFRFVFKYADPTCYISRNGIITPIIKIKLKEQLPIERVIIGPQVTDEIAEQGLSRLLRHNGYNGDIVQRSNMKIRK